MIVCSAGVRAALAGGICWASGVLAQTAPPSPTPTPAQQPVIASPAETLAPRPGIAVPWPDAMAGSTGAAPMAEASGDIRYTVAVTGLDELKLTPRFRADSALVKGRGEIANLAQINRRATEDSDLIDQLLRSLGYYGGKTVVIITPGTSVAVLLAVEPGPLYHLGNVALTVPGGDPAIAEAGLGIHKGDAMSAAAVGSAEDGLRRSLGVRGYAFATIDPPVITVDHATRTATLVQRVDPGRPGRFGHIRIVGKSLLDVRQIERLARFKPGDPYTPADLDDLRRALVATGLLGGVTLTPVAAGPDASGGQVIDVAVTTEVAPLRTVAATAGYSTSQGIRVEASWEHRNLLPPNGAVTFRGIAAEREQLVGAELRRQNWRARDVTLDLNAAISHTTVDAFNAKTLTLTAAVQRETNLIWQKQWYYSAGPELVLSNEQDKSEPGNPVRTYYIAAFPTSLTYDGSNNLLDPTRGFRLTGRASPEVSFQGSTFGYIKLQIDASTYLPLTDRITLAARGHLGSIAGATQRNIAPSRRFYSGGGGSVRGFGYQNVGPKDADGTPRGGDSVTEASFEARFRLGDFGIVPFIDVGQVYTSTIPRFDSLRVGAGIGARYYTSFGPVRIDLATPVDRQKGDAVVQFYVSIGQAF